MLIAGRNGLTLIQKSSKTLVSKKAIAFTTFVPRIWKYQV